MSSTPKIEDITKAREEFGDYAKEIGDPNARYVVSKNKSSQQKTGVSNVAIVKDKLKDRKYAISLTATVTGSANDSLQDEEHLALLQVLFTKFLEGIETKF